jgi:hypothetical protein
MPRNTAAHYALPTTYIYIYHSPLRCTATTHLVVAYILLLHSLDNPRECRCTLSYYQQPQCTVFFIPPGLPMTTVAHLVQVSAV